MEFGHKKYIGQGKSEDLIQEDSVLDEIIKLFDEEKDKDKLRNRLHYEIMSHFFCCHNGEVTVMKITEELFKDRFEEAQREVYSHNNYGWHQMFTLMMRDISEDLEELEKIT